MTTPAGLSEPRGPRVVVVRAGAVSGRLPVRAGVVTLALLAGLAVLVVLDLGLGDFDIPPADVVRALLGGGDAYQQLVVRDLRLPQTLVGVLVGAGLGLAGALTQTLARNPLASPDVLGITEGASVGAVTAILASGATGYGAGVVSGQLQQVGVPLAAFGGAVATAVLLYALAWRHGIDGPRLVLVGIGLSATLAALTNWLLVRARIQDAGTAQVWLNGSLTNRGWDQAWPLVWTLTALVPVALALGLALGVLQLGDDNARGLGLRLQTTQLLVLTAAVGLVAVAVSAVGPLEFVAFVVPQIALRLVRGSRPPLVASMAAGACLVVAADLVTRVLLPFPVPVGLVTAAVGAPYLIHLLLRTTRKVST